MTIRILSTGQLWSDTEINVIQRNQPLNANVSAWRLTASGNLEINYQLDASVPPIMFMPSGADTYANLNNPQIPYFSQVAGLTGNPNCIVPIKPPALRPCYLTFTGDGSAPVIQDGNVPIGRIQMVNVVTILEAGQFGTPGSGVYTGLAAIQTASNTNINVTREWYWYAGVGSSSGQIIVNNQSAIGNQPLQIKGLSTLSIPVMTVWLNGTLDATYRVAHYFGYALNNTAVGSVIINNSSGALAFPSDYRIKRDVRDLDKGLDLVRRIRPVKFRWLRGDNEPRAGFIAHELQEVLPRAVSGQRDEIDSHGRPVYQSIDARKTIPGIASALRQISSELRDIQQQIQNQGA